MITIGLKVIHDPSEATTEELLASFSFWFYGKKNSPHAKSTLYGRKYYEDYFRKTGFRIFTTMDTSYFKETAEAIDASK
jgi:hypothetical protein